ncbi:ribitol-5-phosphate 2-dehydrogenase [Staphylococcus aureus]|uniref:Ribitol-5-phosphate 2-dehydrogenase n=1 Tax=Staphylococcus aureus TaxID=1280 RepID=A0A2X2K3V0_STAAU|nr:ribitol-5-phosphate 2-dehydrogenase [Staphylococcus aureus]
MIYIVSTQTLLKKLALLKGHEINVCTMQDIVQAFEMDLSTSWGKNSIEMDDLINRWGNNNDKNETSNTY